MFVIRVGFAFVVIALFILLTILTAGLFLIFLFPVFFFML